MFMYMIHIQNNIQHHTQVDNQLHSISYQSYSSFSTDAYERILNQREERHSISEMRSSPGGIRQDLELGEIKKGTTNAKVIIIIIGNE